MRSASRSTRPFADLTRLFPSPDRIAAATPEQIGRLGIVRQRVRALQALAAEVAAGRLALNRGAPLATTLDALRALPGIGEWTVQLIAMRALAWPDAFPGQRHRRDECARHARREGGGRAIRSLAALALVRRDAAVAIPGDRNMTVRPSTASRSSRKPTSTPRSGR